ncbi:MAG: hypothetical protein KKI09_07780 [Spirochaetes bacterium]|nr:hypothetical protein [Spirochaetota bacterium]
MTGRIEGKSTNLQQANQLLEQRVQERTVAMEKSLQELEFAQEQLIHSEKLSAQGQLSAGMAHELNTPLGAILLSTRLILDFFDKELFRLLGFYAQLDQTRRDALLQLYQLRQSAACRQMIMLWPSCANPGSRFNWPTSYAVIPTTPQQEPPAYEQGHNTQCGR